MLPVETHRLLTDRKRHMAIVIADALIFRSWIAFVYVVPGVIGRLMVNLTGYVLVVMSGTLFLPVAAALPVVSSGTIHNV